MTMEWCKSKNGNDVILLENDAYLNFGRDKVVTYIHLSYEDKEGVRRGELLPVSLNNIQREYKSVIGKKNLLSLKKIIIDRLDGETLSRKRVYELGEIVNIEERKQTKAKSKKSK